MLRRQRFIEMLSLNWVPQTRIIFTEFLVHALLSRDKNQYSFREVNVKVELRVNKKQKNKTTEVTNLLYPKEKLLISLVQEGVLQIEVRLLPSHKDWEIGRLSSLMSTFLRESSQVCEKDSLVSVNWEEAFKMIHISREQKKNREQFQVHVF